jgi:hypothetical protein
MAENPDEEAPMDAARFFKAYGRDVNIAETQLNYDPGTRRLTAVTGTRAEVRSKDQRERILALVAGTPGILTGGIESGLGGKKEGLANRLLALCESGVLRMDQVGKAKRYYPGRSFPLPPVSPGGTGSHYSPPLHRGNMTDDQQIQFENPDDE